MFNLKFSHRKVLRKVFWSYFELQNQCLDHLERAFLSFFANPWMTKLKAFFGKVWKSVQNYLNQNLVIGSFLQKCFVGILSWKTNALSVWKDHFQIFCKSFCDKVETVCWKSQAKCPKLFKSKYGYRKLVRKWF